MSQGAGARKQVYELTLDDLIEHLALAAFWTGGSAEPGAGQTDVETGRARRGGARLVAANSDETHRAAQLQFSWLAPGVSPFHRMKIVFLPNRSGLDEIAAAGHKKRAG